MIRPTLRSKRSFHRSMPAGPAAAALYGYGYNPCRPSILSVAHDEANGGALFLITDRPCRLEGTGLNLPLWLGEAPAPIVQAAAALDVKFALVLSAPVPAGAPWRWEAGPSDLVDAAGALAPNPARGTCDDFPGPFVPPALAQVINASGSGFSAALTFDRPVVRQGYDLDDAIRFNGMAPAAVDQFTPETLVFQLAGYLSAGDPWEISRQPIYLATPLALPQGGLL